MHVRVVQRALERRVGQNQVEAVAGHLRKLLGEVVAQRVLIVDVRRVDSVQHQVHGRNAEHRDVEVEPVIHAALDVLPLGWRDAVTGESCDFFAIDFFNHLAVV